MHDSVKRDPRAQRAVVQYRLIWLKPGCAAGQGTGKPPSGSGAVIDWNPSIDNLFFFQLTVSLNVQIDRTVKHACMFCRLEEIQANEEYGGYNSFQNVDFNANVLI